MRDFIQNIKALQDYINTEALDDIGDEAVSHYKKSFRDEAFSDKSEKDMPWQEVKRRQGNKRKKRAANTRKILTGDTGDLGRSIDYRKENRAVIITNPKIYAKVHNEGGKAGKTEFTMPKRQFIGPSLILNRKLKSRLTRNFKRILK
ncbi:hypothetical protein FUAX_40960 (plasmid) [Fulvitalea axinellae]|uniref:Phage virion morphogenesis protein n=1 Tax=Fulvitalea axinellae TaxID=1182444 RepID=A0AAU9CYT2_9BACT|nr:hypothetical protein FUAX_40960 [Fulvitalea axinellae]